MISRVIVIRFNANEITVDHGRLGKRVEVMRQTHLFNRLKSAKIRISKKDEIETDQI